MAAVYPTSLKSFTTKTNKVDLVDAAHVNDLQNEVVAIETELGTDVAGSATDLKTRLAVCIGTDGALSKGTSFPVSPAPIDGQMFYRTDEDTLYVYDGANWDVQAGVHGVQAFTTPGTDTFTCPAGITKVFVSLVGGGGGGGGGSSEGAGGGGGGEGILDYPYAVIAGSNYGVVVGSGGTRGSASSGGNGGSSSFGTGTVITVSGGTGGSTSSGGAGAAANSMDGSTTTGGQFYSIAGGAGAAKNSNNGGGGGGSIFGIGGNGSTGEQNGYDGTGYGAGGGGANTNKDGGLGAPGIVIVLY